MINIMLDLHINNDLQINIHIDINTNIDINMNIDIRLIIEMDRNIGIPKSYLRRPAGLFIFVCSMPFDKKVRSEMFDICCQCLCIFLHVCQYFLIIVKMRHCVPNNILVYPSLSLLLWGVRAGGSKSKP